MKSSHPQVSSTRNSLIMSTLAPCASNSSQNCFTPAVNPCLNGGRLTDNGLCECPRTPPPDGRPLYHGERCQHLLLTCKQGTWSPANRNCTCNTGYGGLTCDRISACQNNGTLQLVAQGNKCNCREGSYGELCQHTKGTCIHGDWTWLGETHFCDCYDGYEGFACDVPSCRNGGQATGTGDCSCPVFFGGSTCENDHRLYLIIPLVIILLFLSQYVQRKCRKKKGKTQQQGYIDSLRAFNRDFGNGSAVRSKAMVISGSGMEEEMRTLNKAWRDQHCRLEIIPECDELSSRRSTATEADIGRIAGRIRVNVDVVRRLAQSQSSISDGLDNSSDAGSTQSLRAEHDNNTRPLLLSSSLVGEKSISRSSLVGKKSISRSILGTEDTKQHVALLLSDETTGKPASTGSLPENILSSDPHDEDGNSRQYPWLTTARQLESASSEPFITSSRLNNADESENGPMNADGSGDRPMNVEGSDDRPMNADTSENGPMNAEGSDDRPTNADASGNVPMNAEGSNDRPMNADESENGAMNADGSHDRPMNADGPEDVVKVQQPGTGSTQIVPVHNRPVP